MWRLMHLRHTRWTRRSLNEVCWDEGWQLTAVNTANTGVRLFVGLFITETLASTNQKMVQIFQIAEILRPQWCDGSLD